MAKKKKASGGLSFNMAEEIRKLLQGNPNQSGPEVCAALQQKFPSDSINPSSCSVAFSGARQKLGIKGRGRKAKKAGSKRKTVTRPTPAAMSRASRSSGLDLSAIEQAQKFVAACGGLKSARAAIDQLESLQVAGS